MMKHHVAFAVALATVVTACSDNSSRLASPAPHTLNAPSYAVTLGSDGNPVPTSSDRILVDTRTSLQNATSLSAAWALFPGNDHSASSASAGTGWAFSTNFDGQGTHALRADWEADPSCSSSTVRIITYFPTPKPKQLFIQWRQYLGRSSADPGGLGSVGTFKVTNTACPTRGRQEMRVLRAGVGGGSTNEIDHLWTGSASTPATPSMRTASGTFGGNQGWSFFPEQNTGRVVTITAYLQAESASGAGDGVITVWINGQQFISRTGITTNANAFDRFELPSMFAGVPVNESEYFWGVVAWQPTATTGGSTVTVSPAAATIDTGRTVQLTAAVTDSSGSPVSNPSVAWSSSNSAAATVNASGLVTGVGAGTATITASSNGSSGHASITVNAPAAPPAPVKSVSVALAASQLNVGQTTTATATLRDSAGNTLSGRSIAWTSSNTNVATVGTSGPNTATVTAVGSGTANIIATSEGVSGQAALTVASPPPPPTAASVTVSPSSVTMNVGASSALTVTVRDASGNVISRPVTWQSSSSGVASLSNTSNSGATVTGNAQGSATITATADGVNGTSAVTVNAPPPPPPSGCATPQAGWIWCDDFEADHTSSYFEYTNPGGNSFTRQAGGGMNGSTSMRARWTSGQVDAGSLKLSFGQNPSSYMRPVDAGTAKYREIYWRVYVKSQAGWRPNGNDKFTRAIVFARSDWSEAAIAHVWGGSGSTSQNFYVLDPASGVDASGNVATSGYNDFAHLRFLGAVQGKVPVFGSGAGQWYCVEAHMKLNDPGQSNGVEEEWINGTLDAQATGLNFTGTYTAYGINALFLEAYINNGAPQAQVRDFDNYVVSTQRIGCQ